MKAIIAGGGTGGHLFPGIAVAREIERRHPGSEILFVGADRGIETQIIPREGFPLRTLPIAGLKGMGIFRQVKNAVAMVAGLFRARGILGSFKPDIVIGVGGYASFPILGAAILGGFPRLIMEQNAIPGLANRTLGRWVDYAAVTDPGSSAFFGERAVVTGNPVRPQFKSIPARVHVPPYTVLVFGGSQGANAINKAVMESLCFLSDLRPLLSFVHQTGERQVQDVKRAYETTGFTADVRAFFDDFHEQYQACDLIVSRAGATTIAEVKAAGRAAILVPLPTATDDHQTRNALAMSEQNAAVLLRNADLSGQRLADEIRALILSPERLRAMETTARSMAVLDAETRIVNLVESAVARHHRN